VAGLVAGRLAERFHRPSVVMSTDGDNLVASARSIPEFNLVEAFESCEHLFVRYGGHSQAAGFTMARHNLPALSQNLTDFAQKALGSVDLRPKLNIDAEVRLADLTDGLLHWLSVLAPFGQSNTAPVFLTRGAQVLESRYMGKSRQHFALKVRDGQQDWTALAFNLGERWEAGTPYVDLVYTVTHDHWRGPGALALRVLDFRSASN
ncbi:MAG: single-stranded-DNA-specific exonuclease RecJ, partial [Chloroflexi bacterium]|nr:single-stranded-DNA-specific exonuclease RecJ [Chloroflexota bacterium]